MGYGFAWNPSDITINVNDVIIWEWKSPYVKIRAKYTVLETFNEYTSHNGTGFKSPTQPSHEGTSV